ncbi:IS3 family transposase [Pedobacter sp. JCM 36344]|uniref:IS3 family transposase n=1 Tax=Pedobacter sp. JCM 36344 TaxID=3374280 RepID=UPI0039797393
MTQLIKEEQGISVQTLCSLFGKSRNAWYDSQRKTEKDILTRDIVLQEVNKLRNDLPGIGTRKLHYLLQNILLEHNIAVGRDYLFDLLAANGLLVARRRRRFITTDSNHWMKKYDNRTFVYLSLITDAYSRQIMGYHLHNDLSTEGCLQALKMAIEKRNTQDLPLMHHSDRGSQYCSKAYVDVLKNNNIAISMTKNGDPYENAMAERVNGILKTEFSIDRNTGSFESLKVKLDKVISSYNTIRPHASLGYLTPVQAHKKLGELNKNWKNYRKEKWDRKIQQQQNSIAILGDN